MIPRSSSDPQVTAAAGLDALGAATELRVGASRCVLSLDTELRVDAPAARCFWTLAAGNGSSGQNVLHADRCLCPPGVLVRSTSHQRPPAPPFRRPTEGARSGKGLFHATDGGIVCSIVPTA